MWPLPLMPDQWQPPRQRAAKVSSFAAANGRIGMVFIRIESLLNEMQLQAGLDSEIGQMTADNPPPPWPGHGVASVISTDERRSQEGRAAGQDHQKY
jgi:hypothetical protein